MKKIVKMLSIMMALVFGLSCFVGCDDEPVETYSEKEKAYEEALQQMLDGAEIVFKDPDASLDNAKGSFTVKIPAAPEKIKNNMYNPEFSTVDDNDFGVFVSCKDFSSNQGIGEEWNIYQQFAEKTVKVNLRLSTWGTPASRDRTWELKIPKMAEGNFLDESYVKKYNSDYKKDPNFDKDEFSKKNGRYEYKFKDNELTCVYEYYELDKETYEYKDTKYTFALKGTYTAIDSNNFLYNITHTKYDNDEDFVPLEADRKDSFSGIKVNASLSYNKDLGASKDKKVNVIKESVVYNPDKKWYLQPANEWEAKDKDKDKDLSLTVYHRVEKDYNNYLFPLFSMYQSATEPEGVGKSWSSGKFTSEKCDEIKFKFQKGYDLNEESVIFKVAQGPGQDSDGKACQILTLTNRADPKEKYELKLENKSLASIIRSGATNDMKDYFMYNWADEGEEFAQATVGFEAGNQFELTDTDDEGNEILEIYDFESATAGKCQKYKKTVVSSSVRAAVPDGYIKDGEPVSFTYDPKLGILVKEGESEEKGKAFFNYGDKTYVVYYGKVKMPSAAVEAEIGEGEEEEGEEAEAEAGEGEEEDCLFIPYGTKESGDGLYGGWEFRYFTEKPWKLWIYNTNNEKGWTVVYKDGSKDEGTWEYNHEATPPYYYDTSDQDDWGSWICIGGKCLVPFVSDTDEETGETFKNWDVVKIK